MQFFSVLLLALGATAVVAKDSKTATGAAVEATATGKGSGSKATGTASGKATKTSGVAMSTGGASSLMGNKKELVTVAGLGVAFAVFI